MAGTGLACTAARLCTHATLGAVAGGVLYGVYQRKARALLWQRHLLAERCFKCQVTLMLQSINTRAKLSFKRACLEVPPLKEAPRPAVVVIAAVGRAPQLLLPLGPQRPACAGLPRRGEAAVSATCSRAYKKPHRHCRSMCHRLACPAPLQGEGVEKPAAWTWQA